MTAGGEDLDSSDPELESLLDFLHRSRGFDFSGYKRGTLTRRIGKRMSDLGADSYAVYRDLLESNPEEFTDLFNTILINVTAFFRDPDAWTYLSDEVIPEVLRAAGDDQPIRVWSAGCASGEESYSLAMLLAEALGTEQFGRRVKIYGTDVDEEALEQARQGHYTAQQLEGVPDDLREKYFSKVDGTEAFKADLRRSVIFGRHDLTQDAPISKLDLLVCRNALMYLNAETQARVLARFHFAMRPSGYLFLGRAEMLLSHSRLFTPAQVEHRIFTKTPGSSAAQTLFASPALLEAGPQDADAVRDLGFDAAPVIQLVVDADGVLIAANRRARLAFSLTEQDLGRLLRDLEVSYRPVELRGPIEQALAEGRTVELPNVERYENGATTTWYDVVITPLRPAEGVPLGVTVAFCDITEIHQVRGDLERSKEELETANEELQSTNEELETTNEELQSTNEELETTNEELQSTNEELETMNEELHSTNEQLEAVNDELRRSSMDLDHANGFMQSVLASLSAAVVVLDSSWVVRVWNEAAEDLWGLSADRVVGRSFFSLDIGLPVGELRAPLQSCFEDGSTGEQLVEATDRRGQVLQCRVSCTPLGPIEGDDKGIVLLMEPGR